MISTEILMSFTCCGNFLGTNFILLANDLVVRFDIGNRNEVPLWI